MQAGAARPSYTFNNLWDFANDAPLQEQGNFDPITGRPTDARKYIRSNIYAGFVQDDFKVKPNLTLNLGVRWEPQMTPAEIVPRLDQRIAENFRLSPMPLFLQVSLSQLQ